jgi:hypothetical protein
LKKEVGELSSLAEHTKYFLRVLESYCADFWKRVDVNYLRAATLCFLQACQHARVIRSWILAYDEDSVGQVEIFERDCAFAYAYGFGQGRTARFMTHVRAVRKIVCAELANEELIEKRSLVAGAARGVEDSFIGRSERVQLFGNERECFVPTDRFIVHGIAL